jgi:hypothetical protein
VENRPLFGKIDLLAGEHRGNPCGQIALAGIGDEQRHGLGRQPLLRPVGEPIVPGERQLREALRIRGEERRERTAGERAPVIDKRLPAGRGRDFVHAGSSRVRVNSR